MSETSPFSKERLTGWIADLQVCLRFCTRVPIPAPATGSSDLAASAAMLPVAGALVGAAAAIILWLANRLGLPNSVAALAAVVSLIILTGGLHEDGLADFADAAGGATPDERLAIMKDSRIGAFGGLALVISVIARVMTLALIAEQSLSLAAMVLIAAAASSRTFALWPLYVLAPARADGLGAETASPKEGAFVTAGLWTLLFSLFPLFAGAGLIRVLCALIISAAAAYGMIVQARRLIQGQTGDVAGAIQQVAEITTYLVFTSQL